MGFSAIASAVSFSILGRDQTFADFDRAGWREIDKDAAFLVLPRLAVLPVGEAVFLRHRDPRRAGLVVLPQFLDRFLLQGEELLGIVKIGSLVLGKEVGGDGACVFLGREYRQSHGRAIIQQRGPDLVGAVVAAARDLLHDARLRLVTAQGQGFRLRKRDHAFRQRGLGFPAQIVERETPLDGRGAQSCLRDHIIKSDALMNQLGQRSRFLQRREILPLQILDGGNPQRVVLGEVVAYLDRDREILRQFAALLQQAQRLEVAATR